MFSFRLEPRVVCANSVGLCRFPRLDYLPPPAEEEFVPDWSAGSETEEEFVPDWSA